MTRVYEKRSVVEALDSSSRCEEEGKIGMTKSYTNSDVKEGRNKNTFQDGEREFETQRSSVTCCWIDND